MAETGVLVGRPARGLLVTAGALLVVHAVPELLSALGALGHAAPLPYAFEELGRQPLAVAGVGAGCGLLRILAAAGILADREWGWVLGVLVSAITFSMLTLYLPFGAVDGLLAGAVLALLVIARYQGRAIGGGPR